MSYYFSLVELEPEAMMHPGARENLRRLSRMGEAYRDHCLIMKLFPGLQQRFTQTDREARSADFVFRQRTEREHPQSLGWYVVSMEEPEPVPGLLGVRTKHYDPTVRPGEMVRFQLRANPSVTRVRRDKPGLGGGKRNPHHDVLMLAKREMNHGTLREDRHIRIQAAATDWLLTRGLIHGLRVLPESISIEAYTQHQIFRRGMEYPMSFSSVDYNGIAETTDTALLRKALLEGIGRKRSFGCGLLLVRRLDAQAERVNKNEAHGIEV